jgi:hypothetical protein
MLGGALIGAVWGGAVVGGVAGAIAGIFVFALLGLLVGFIGGIIAGVVAALLPSTQVVPHLAERRRNSPTNDTADNKSAAELNIQAGPADWLPR